MLHQQQVHHVKLAAGESHAALLTAVVADGVAVRHDGCARLREAAPPGAVRRT
jgi:hypothetical protein